MIGVIIITNLLFSQISCLRWGPSGESKLLDSPVALSLTPSDPAIDVYSGDQVIIYKDIGTYVSPFTIYCLVSGYGNKSDLVYRFCKEDTCPNEWKETELFTNIQMFGYKISRAKNPAGKMGLVLQLQFPSSSIDSSGNYHIEVQDRVGKFMVRSNDIQIRDTYYWSQNIVLDNSNIKTIYPTNVTRDKLPITFKCSENGLMYNPGKPNWYQQLPLNPVEWSVCPVKPNFETLKAKEKQTFDKCVRYTTQIFSGDDAIRPTAIYDMIRLTSYVDNDGNLQIYDMKIDTSQIDVTYALMCYIKGNNGATPINTYIQSFTGNEIISGVPFIGTPSSYSIPLKAISPLKQNVELYLRKIVKDDSKTRVVSLIALYQASSAAKWFWQYNGEQLNSGTTIQPDKYSVKFVAGITEGMAGTYTLDVTDGADKLTFTFNVKVLGPPILVDSNCMPMVQYVKESASTSFRCSYKNQPKLLELKINSENIIFGQSLGVSTASLKKSYSYLTELNFTIQSFPQLPSDTVTIVYQAFNLRKSLGQTQYQDHTVMFLVKNEFGVNLKTSSIYVIPNLNNLIDSSPESYNCTTDCSSLVSHKFQCRVRVEQYENKELEVDYYWMVRGHRLGPNTNNLFAPYFTLDTATNELTLHPIKSNNTKSDESVKEALKDTFIECHVDFKSSPNVVPKYTYYSSNDPSLKFKMKAIITLDYQPINSAYVYWVVAVILVLVVILLIGVLIVRHFNKNKGETYQLDKMERRHGYNPEKEMQEQIFKHYEREENENMGSDEQSVDSENKYETHPYDYNASLTRR